MTRIRTIKPELFAHESLYEAEQQSNLPLRLAFIGLLTCCDREGRFRWRPRQLKLNVLPYDENIDFEAILNCLVIHGFVIKYEVNQQHYGCFPSWHKHQRVNNKEAGSELPAVEEGQVVVIKYPLSTGISSVGYASAMCEASVNHISVRPEISVNHASVTDGSRVKHTCDTENQVGISSLDLPSGEGEREGKGKEGEEEGKGGSPEPPRELHVSPSVLPEIIAIPLSGGGEYPITQEQIFQWEALYPGIDVLQSLRNILGWNLANPKRRKTRAGVLSHINTWLAKEQNNAGKPMLSANNRAPPYKHSPDLQEYNIRVAEQWIRESEVKIVDGEVVK